MSLSVSVGFFTIISFDKPMGDQSEPNFSLGSFSELYSILQQYSFVFPRTKVANCLHNGKILTEVIAGNFLPIYAETFRILFLPKYKRIAATNRWAKPWELEFDIHKLLTAIEYLFIPRKSRENSKSVCLKTVKASPLLSM